MDNFLEKLQIIASVALLLNEKDENRSADQAEEYLKKMEEESIAHLNVYKALLDPFRDYEDWRRRTIEVKEVGDQANTVL